MRLGIFAKTFSRPTLEQTLDAVVSHGFTHIQFNMSCMGLATLPDKLDEGSCVWIAQQLQERGLTMAAISGTFNMVDHNGDRLQQNLRRLEVLASACRWLDTRIITLCTGSADSHDMWKWHPDNFSKSTWERLRETTRAAVAIADRYEVTLAFEPETNNVVSTVMRARRLLDEIDSPWLKVVIDPANLVRSGDMPRLIEILDEAFDWIGADIVLAHAKEPVLEEFDAKALDKSTEIALRSKLLHYYLRAAAVGEPVERLREIWLNYPPSSLLDKQKFHFYYPYFSELTRINYQGAVVIHGLDEGEVDSRTALLRPTLKLFQTGGETDAGP